MEGSRACLTDCCESISRGELVGGLSLDGSRKKGQVRSRKMVAVVCYRNNEIKHPTSTQEQEMPTEPGEQRSFVEPLWRRYHRAFVQHSSGKQPVTPPPPRQRFPASGAAHRLYFTSVHLFYQRHKSIIRRFKRLLLLHLLDLGKLAEIMMILNFKAVVVIVFQHF